MDNIIWAHKENIRPSIEAILWNKMCQSKVGLGNFKFLCLIYVGFFFSSCITNYESALYSFWTPEY